MSNNLLQKEKLNLFDSSCHNTLIRVKNPFINDDDFDKVKELICIEMIRVLEKEGKLCSDLSDYSKIEYVKNVLRDSNFYSILPIWKTKDGKLTKRLGKEVHKALKNIGITYSLSNEIRSAIGNILEPIINNDLGIMIWKVDRDKLWERGNFCDHKSCFWSDKADVQYILDDYPFYALLVFNKNIFDQFDEGNSAFSKGMYKYGMYRAWIYAGGNYGIVFNGYGQSTKMLYLLLKNVFGLEGKECNVTNKNAHDGLLWINNKGKGYIVYYNDNKPDVSGLEYLNGDYSVFDFCIDVDEYRLHCDECDSIHNVHFCQPYDGYLCNGCFDDLYCTDYNGNYIRIDEAVYIDGDYYHTDDVDDNFIRCPHCNEYIRK